MSRKPRDDPRASGERTPEQRERERLERVARRARSEGASTAHAPPPDPQPAEPSETYDRRPPPPDSPRDRPAGRRGRGAKRVLPAARAGDERAGGRDRTPLRIQPDPPAPPAAAAGSLYDETDAPIGIRRARRAVASRNPRTVVTPPGDVRAGPAMAPRSVRSRVTAIAVLVILFAVIIGVFMLFQPFGSAEGAEVKVMIPGGASAHQIGDLLASKGVVSSGLLFSWRARLAGKRGDLRSGRFTLKRGMTYGAALDALGDRSVVTKAATTKVTIPEGRSRKEIADLVSSADLDGGYLAASKRFSGRLNPFRYGAPKGTRALEGFLFPSTYEFDPGAPMADLVTKQLATFRKTFSTVDLKLAKSKNLTAYEVLIIASMIEREAQVPGERPKIAAVIYNRLKDRTPLGIDATIRYKTGNWTTPLTESELQIDSAYNTRLRRGLPPTPIGNPGIASIRAAAHPADVEYRYYVVKPGACGEHSFSSTFAQFDRDRQSYDQARNAAGGQSPTSCP